MSNKFKIFETTIIICVGMFMHLYRLSIIELRSSKLPVLMPNAASSLFVFSILCLFAKLRPLWPQVLHMPQKFLIFLVELALILCSTDFLLHQLWLPSLRLLNFICNYLGHYVLVANQNYMLYNAPQLSNWIRNEAFYIARFMLSVIVFIFMIKTTDIMQLLRPKILNNIPNVNAKLSEVIETSNENQLQGIRRSFVCLKSAPFDVNQLPCVPQEDILIMAHRASRRRKSCGRRRKKIVLKNEDDLYEVNC